MRDTRTLRPATAESKETAKGMRWHQPLTWCSHGRSRCQAPRRDRSLPQHTVISRLTQDAGAGPKPEARPQERARCVPRGQQEPPAPHPAPLTGTSSEDTHRRTASPLAMVRNVLGSPPQRTAAPSESPRLAQTSSPHAGLPAKAVPGERTTEPCQGRRLGHGAPLASCGHMTTLVPLTQHIFCLSTESRSTAVTILALGAPRRGCQRAPGTSLLSHGDRSRTAPWRRSLKKKTTQL